MLVVVKGGLVSASLQSMGGGGSGGACLIAWAHSNPSVCQVGLAELDWESLSNIKWHNFQLVVN